MGTSFKVQILSAGLLLFFLFFGSINLLSGKTAGLPFAILEYNFPWPPYDLKSPWRSAMAQAEALPVLGTAFNITNDTRYLDTAELILNSLFVEVGEGGVTYKDAADGWWYELYAGDNSSKPRVLNGMLFTLLALHKYYNLTDNTKAIYLFEQGMRGLETNLINYDRNGSSYYDSLGNPSRLEYHIYHVQLLSNLYKITKDPILKVYYDRWRIFDPGEFMTQPPANIMLDDANVPFVDYGTLDGVYIGPQRNPVTVSHIAMKYYERYQTYGDQDALIAFLNNAKWLVDNAVPSVLSN